MLLKPCQGHCSLHSASRAAVDADILRLVLLQKLLVNGCNIFARSGKFVVRALTIIDTDDLNLSQGRNRNGLELGATGPAPGESASMKIDQDFISILR